MPFLENCSGILRLSNRDPVHQPKGTAKAFRVWEPSAEAGPGTFCIAGYLSRGIIWDQASCFSAKQWPHYSYPSLLGSDVVLWVSGRTCRTLTELDSRRSRISHPRASTVATLCGVANSPPPSAQNSIAISSRQAALAYIPPVRAELQPFKMMLYLCVADT